MSDCCCGTPSEKKIIQLFACSGSANVGEIADRAARCLMAEGRGSMSCLAGLGGDVTSMIQAAKQVDGNIVIDGCPQQCGRKVMERAGVTNFRHIRVTDLGIDKVKGIWAGQQQVQQVVDHVKATCLGPINP